jgi:hypothetical protein
MLVVLVCGLLADGSLRAQERGPNLAAQKEAMQKLAFLVGKWSGPATAVLGPGEPLKITQMEHVQYKLDGLVLLVEGAGLNAEGKVLFNALATISFDDATGTYRFRAFNRGRYLDTELKVRENGVTWGYTAGPLTVENVMNLDAEGAWVETTDVKFGDNPTRRTVEMRVTKEK